MAARKSEGGLGKTARSSTVFDREAGNKPSGHTCAACSKPIVIREHLPVMQTVVARSVRVTRDARCLGDV